MPSSNWWILLFIGLRSQFSADEDHSGNLVNNYIPTGLDPISMVLRNGELWMLGRGGNEEERDHVSLFRVELILDRDVK